MLIADITLQSDDHSRILAIITTETLVLLGIWRFVHWVANAPAAQDPWDEKISAEMDEEDSPALCHRCLEPHEEQTHFCPNCGAPVGQFTNVLPFEHLFSIGDALRVGTRGEFRRTPFTVVGYLLLALAEYSIFAPVYWGFLAKKVNNPDVIPDEPPPPPNPQPDT